MILQLSLLFVELYTIFKKGLTKHLIERKRPHRYALLLKMLLLQEGHHLHFIYSKNQSLEILYCYFDF